MKKNEPLGNINIRVVFLQIENCSFLYVLGSNKPGTSNSNEFIVSNTQISLLSDDGIYSIII